MTDHPITPPPELINQWWDEAHQTAKYDEPIGLLVATRAAQYGADQELDACCEWLEDIGPSGVQLWGDDLRKDRRPKPPSLKEQALEAQQRLMTGAWRAEDWQLIGRALEALPDD